MKLTKKRTLRQYSIILFYAIITWWTYDHLVPLLPAKTYEYLPEIDTYIPDYEFEIPTFELDFHKPLYNKSKQALLIENRNTPDLAPLMLHMMSVIPPDWTFRFMGTKESVAYVNRSAAIKRKYEAGKLDYAYIPSHVSIAGQEDVNRFLTNPWLYEVGVQPAEWLLVYQTDSIMCANSLDSIDNYLEYDWVGAPWSGQSRYGGNGGLSMRRVSSIIEVLQHQERRNNSDPEDVWLTERLGHLPHMKTANGSVSIKFSGEMHWVEEPMGYHIGSSGRVLNGGLWGNLERRLKIYDYCPEVKMALDMDVEMMMGPGFCGEQF